MGDIAVIGTGYVGLTTGACFAHLGHDVVCADVDPRRSSGSQRGEIPILEAGLDELVREGLQSGRLSFVLGAANAVADRRVRLPVRAHAPGRGRLGRPDLHRGGRRRDRARCCHRGRSSSTSRPCRSARPGVVEQALGRSDVYVVSNPEFLREGSAVHDFLHPDRVVIGCDDQAAAIRVAALYLGVAAPLHGHRPGLGRDHQVRQQRLPGHQDQLRQRHRRGVRGGRRRRQRRGARHGLRQAHRPRVPPPRPGLGRLLLPEGLHALRPHRRGGGLRLRPAQGRHQRQRGAVRPGGRQGRDAWPAARSRARSSPCGASRSRPAPTTCATRRRSRSSSACWPRARSCGPTTRRSTGPLDQVAGHRGGGRPVRRLRRRRGARRAHRVGRVQVARPRQGRPT